MSGLPTTYVAAVDEMFAKTKAAALATATTVGILSPDVRFVGRAQTTQAAPTKFTVEVSQTTESTKQSAFGIGRKRYTTKGVLYARISAPQAGANGYELGRKWGEGIRNAFRVGDPGAKVWYRNAKVQELSAERDTYRFNVSVDYVYDELQ